MLQYMKEGALVSTIQKNIPNIFKVGEYMLQYMKEGALVSTI